jgi:hypothetical protein
MGGFPPQGGGTGTDIDVNVTDRASRLLGIIYGSQGQQVLQRAATFELLVQLRNAGVDIDPTQIRSLDFATDSVDISGSSVSISDTPDVNVTDRASRLLGIIYGSQGQQVLQRAATFELLVQLRNAGVDIDPRDRNWDLNFTTDQVDISGSSVDVTDRAARLVGVTYGSQGQQLRQDLSSTDLGTIETVHGMIHRGNLYNVSVVSTGINIATPKRILITTPNTDIRAHMVFEIESQPGITFEFYEDTTTSNDGTALSEINHRRANPNVATVVATEDPTVTADGTLLFSFRSGTSTSGGRIGGLITTRASEFILDQNTKYQLKLTPLANNTAISTLAEWYEI